MRGIAEVLSERSSALCWVMKSIWYEGSSFGGSVPTMDVPTYSCLCCDT